MQSVKRIVLAGIIFPGTMGGFGVSKTAIFSSSDAGESEPDLAGWKSSEGILRPCNGD